MGVVDAGAPNADAVLNDVSERGAAIYERLRSSLERDHFGEVVAIHPDTGEYVVSRFRNDAVRRLLSQQPNGMMFVTRIGPPNEADLSVIERLEGATK